MSSNMERLGGILTTRMKETSKSAIPTTVELGIINGDLSLTVDSLPTPIPPEEYMIDLILTHNTYYTYNELYNTDMVPTRSPHVHKGREAAHLQAAGDGVHIHNTDGLHDHRVPSVFRKIEPGDRVLVVWIGHEPIIVAIVVAGTTSTSN